MRIQTGGRAPRALRRDSGDGADMAAILADIERVANASPLITFTTMTAHRWPMTHCMHFTISVEGVRPRLYLFTNEGTRKLANIAADPRVGLSVSAYTESGAERIALQLQGLCRQVYDPDEHALAMDEHARRPGYEHTRYLTLQYQPALRIDVVRATLFEGEGFDVRFPTDDVDASLRERADNVASSN